MHAVRRPRTAQLRRQSLRLQRNTQNDRSPVSTKATLTAAATRWRTKRGRRNSTSSVRAAARGEPPSSRHSVDAVVGAWHQCDLERGTGVSLGSRAVGRSSERARAAYLSVAHPDHQPNFFGGRRGQLTPASGARAGSSGSTVATGFTRPAARRTATSFCCCDSRCLRRTRRLGQCSGMTPEPRGMRIVRALVTRWWLGVRLCLE